MSYGSGTGMMSPVGDMHFYAEKNGAKNVLKLWTINGVYPDVYNDVYYGVSISAPILRRWSSFLRRSKVEIQGYRSAQKRAPTDK